MLGSSKALDGPVAFESRTRGSKVRDSCRELPPKEPPVVLVKRADAGRNATPCRLSGSRQRQFGHHPVASRSTKRIRRNGTLQLFAMLHLLRP
jgi:hypothetical protein